MTRGDVVSYPTPGCDEVNQFCIKTQTQIITFGSGTYSDFLGGGQNTFLNPHLDFKFGYASDGDGYFVFGGGANLELFKFKYAFLNLKAEGLGLVGDDGIQWVILGGLDLAIIY